MTCLILPMTSYFRLHLLALIFCHQAFDFALKISEDGGVELARGLCVGLKRVQAQLEGAIEETHKRKQSTPQVTLSSNLSLIEKHFFFFARVGVFNSHHCKVIILALYPCITAGGFGMR